MTPTLFASRRLRIAIGMLSVLLPDGRLLAQKVAAVVPSYEAIASESYKQSMSKVSQFTAAKFIEPTKDCRGVDIRCLGVKRTRAEPDYTGRLLERGRYLAELASETPLPNIPYSSWVPLSQVVGGADALSKWRALAKAQDYNLCAESCSYLIEQEPNERHRERLLSECQIDAGNGSPSKCKIVAIIGSATWVRAAIGWGPQEFAQQLTSSALVESYETDRSLSILQLPPDREATLLTSIASMIQLDPLGLSAELKPPIQPRHVVGKKSGSDSKIIAGLREWPAVRIELYPAVRSIGDTTISTLEISTTLWLSRTASNGPTRPAEAGESLQYQNALLSRITAEIERVCSGKAVANRVVCKSK